MRTLKILGFLLSYPTPTHKEIAAECKELLMQEGWLSQKSITLLVGFFNEFEQKDLLDLQESYVALFDRTPSLSLHLFEHIHGDSRDRGQALADLLMVYEEAGLFINTQEMPDYIPLFCEYLSILSPQEASKNMGSVVNILSCLAERLKNRDSVYTAVFEALIETAASAPDHLAVEQNLKMSAGAPLTAQQIDQAWEEQYAFENAAQSNGQESACPKTSQMLARMHESPKEERV